MNKVLFIISGNSKLGVGEQFLHSMLKDYPPKNIFRYSIVAAISQNVERPYEVKTRVVDLSNKPGLSSLNYRKFLRQDINPCISEINGIILENNIDVVWLFMNSIHSMLIGEKLMEEISIPVIIQIWDSPEYILKKQYIFGSLRQKVLSAFGNVAKKLQKDSRSQISCQKSIKQNLVWTLNPWFFLHLRQLTIS